MGEREDRNRGGETVEATGLAAQVAAQCAALIAHRTLDHQLLAPPVVTGRLIDESSGRAVFVLREHIDIDPGWQGDQFRCSLWVVEPGGEPRQIFEDLSYRRADLPRGHRFAGRDPSIGLRELDEGGVVIEAVRKGDQSGVTQRFRVDFAGVLGEVTSFEEVARNLIERLAPRLGYDYLSGMSVVPGAEVAAVKFTTENGSTFGYDTVFLVWREAGAVSARIICESRDYLTIGSIKVEGHHAAVVVNGRTYTASMMGESGAPGGGT